MDDPHNLGQIALHVWFAVRMMLLFGLAPAAVVTAIGIGLRAFNKEPITGQGWHGPARAGLATAGIINLILLTISLAGLVLLSYGVWEPQDMGTGDRVLPFSSLLTIIGAAWAYIKLMPSDDAAPPDPEHEERGDPCL